MQDTTKEIRDKVVLVGLNSPVLKQEENADENTMEELSALVETAGGETVGIVLQNRPSPDPRTFIGEGKVAEVQLYCENTGATMVIFDNDLSPSQMRVLTQLLGVQVLGAGAVDKVVDVAVAAIAMKAALSDLANLDFAYAPPFSTAIHPFATCLNVLLNKMSGAMKSLTWEQARQEEGWVYVDVAKAPSVPGLPYYPVSAIKGPLEGIDPKAKVLLICTRGRNSYMAQNRLRRYGYENTAVLEGGTVFQPGLAEELGQE